MLFHRTCVSSLFMYPCCITRRAGNMFLALFMQCNKLQGAVHFPVIFHIWRYSRSVRCEGKTEMFTPVWPFYAWMTSLHINAPSLLVLTFWQFNSYLLPPYVHLNDGERVRFTKQTEGYNRARFSAWMGYMSRGGNLTEKKLQWIYPSTKWCWASAGQLATGDFSPPPHHKK